MTDFPRWLSFLGDISATVLVMVTGLYVALTNRLVRVGRDQHSVAREQNAILQAQLEALRVQTALAYEPKVLFKTVTGSLKETYPTHVTFHNFNQLPLMIEFVAFSFKSADNREAYQKWMLDALPPLVGKILEPFSTCELPLPFSFDMEQPTILVSFYYGGTGSQRYEYKAKVSLIDCRVSEEEVSAVARDNRFAFM